MNGFEAIIAVDWSSANVPTKGPNSIWVSVKTVTALNVVNISTRAEAFEFLSTQISQFKGRVLIGFDVSFAYPKGTLKALDLDNWEQLWTLLQELIEDGDKNENNRFEVGALLNKRLAAKNKHKNGPFWGCPVSKQSEFLSMRKPKSFDFPELRVTERNVRGAQSAWKLAYAGSVGGQTLTCIARLWPFVKEMRKYRPTVVWPFENLTFASDEVVFAEVYHSFFSFDKGDQIRDRAQVVGCCEALAVAPLADWLEQASLHPESSEEGWTLGVFGSSNFS